MFRRVEEENFKNNLNSNNTFCIMFVSCVFFASILRCDACFEIHFLSFFFLQIGTDDTLFARANLLDLGLNFGKTCFWR